MHGDESSSLSPGWLGRTLQSRFDPVVVVLSPPRCGSTALARSLWQHKAFRWYLHEPYDCVYHRGSGVTAVAEALEAVLDGAPNSPQHPQATGIVVKEMTFQVGDSVRELLDAATCPAIILVRDPRLAVLSRIQRRAADGDSPCFPAREAGWRDLAATLSMLRGSGSEYIVVDFHDIRRRPAEVLRELCRRLGLDWDARMLSWQSTPELRLGNLEGWQARWYERVLSSTGFQSPDEEIPGPEQFKKTGMLDVVRECVIEYRRARSDPKFLGFGEPPLATAEGWAS